MTADELSALLDGALGDATRARAEHHLAECSECRDTLAALADQERALGPVLEYDPGDAYFESFAARVEDRIRAAGPKGAQARQGDGWLGWMRSPRGLAWVGGMAVAVVGAGVVMLTARLERPDLRSYEAKPTQGAKPAAPETPLPDRSAIDREADGLRSSADASRDRARESESSFAEPPPAVEEQVKQLQKEGTDFAPPSGSSAKTESKTGLARNEASPSPDPQLGASRKDARGNVAPRRLTGSRRTAAGEDVPVARPGAASTPEPAPSVSAPTSDDAVIVKPPASPAERAGITSLTREQERVRNDLNQTLRDAAVTQLCGRVLDPNHRPVSRARVTLVENGRGVATDAQGRFCIDAPPGNHTLSVMAVGFSETRLSARAGSGAPDVAVTLKAVSVLDAPAFRAGRVNDLKLNMDYLSQEPSDVFSALPDSLRAPVREAQAITADGRARRAAGRLDQGAHRWEGVVARMTSEAMRAEASFRLAEARYLAWLYDPTPSLSVGTRAAKLARRQAAIAAIRRALNAAGSPVQGQTLRTWLRELAP